MVCCPTVPAGRIGASSLKELVVTDSMKNRSSSQTANIRRLTRAVDREALRPHRQGTKRFKPFQLIRLMARYQPQAKIILVFPDFCDTAEQVFRDNRKSRQRREGRSVPNILHSRFHLMTGQRQLCAVSDQRLLPAAGGSCGCRETACSAVSQKSGKRV